MIEAATHIAIRRFIPDRSTSPTGAMVHLFWKKLHHERTITLSLLFALLVASTPARAGMLTGRLIESTRAVLTKATHVVVDTAKETFATKESEEDRKASENEEIEKAADQILAQYPEDRRTLYLRWCVVPQRAGCNARRSLSGGIQRNPPTKTA